MKRQDQENSFEQVRKFWRTARYYKWWVFIGAEMLFLISLAGIGLLPNYYRTSTTILVDPQKIPERYVTPTVTTDPSQSLSTLTQEVLSTTRLQEVIDHFHLYPELRSSHSREEIIDHMRSKISIDIRKASSTSVLSTFTISYEGKDLEAVAPVTNQLASSFIEWDLKNRRQRAMVTTEFLNAQLEDSRKSLEEQENKVKDFKMHHLGEMPDQQPANLQTLARLQMEFQANVDGLNRLDAEKTMLLHLPESVATAGAEPTNPGLLSERASLEAEKNALQVQLSDLQRRYTSVHPDLVAAKERLERINAQLLTLPSEGAAGDAKRDSTGKQPSSPAVRLEIIQKEMKRLNEIQQQILGQIASYQAKVDAVPVREQQLTDLSRDYRGSKDRYQSLLDKKFSAAMAEDLELKQQGETFTILDPAGAPEKPSKPNRPLLMGGAAAASLFLALGLVVVKDQLDHSVKSEKEVSEALPSSVPPLASIPTIETPADRRKRLKSAIWVLSLSLVGYLLVAGLYWKLHPSL